MRKNISSNFLNSAFYSTSMNVVFKRNVPYGEILEYQRREFDRRVELRKEGRELPEDLLIIAEHKPVITLGRHGREENLLLPARILSDRGIEVFHIERGGDITYHGPGQLTVYPIIDMKRLHLGVKDYVWLLEEAVINTVREYGIEGQRVDGATGVWIDAGKPSERKISAIGIRCSRHVAMHGLALNVGRDLSGFTAINPCGFTDKGVTSISLETGRDVGLEEVAGKLAANLEKLLYSSSA